MRVEYALFNNYIRYEKSKWKDKNKEKKNKCKENKLKWNKKKEMLRIYYVISN